MLEHTYRATRFDEAIAKVKRELGPDAVIVSSRQINKGMLRGKGEVEVKALPKEAAVQLGLIKDEDATTQVRTSFLERRLTRMDVPTTAARTLSRAVRRMHGGEPKTLEAAREPLRAALEDEMIFAHADDRGARVVALVGPTGVGKTTTIAKIAALAALVERRKVALISIDQYRIGGTEQLQRYADLIGIPMETAHDTGSLEIALRRLGKADLVLVDTAGRSPKDPAAIGAMAETLHGVDEPVEVNLCLSAGMRDSDLCHLVDRLSVVRPTKMIATKLDEAVYHGSLVAAQVHTGLPLVWFTTGQCVPEDIEPASAERLASLLCGEDL